MSQVQSRITKVFQSVFANAELQIDRTTTANDVEDWDSLKHIELIIALESEFAVKFKTAEVGQLSNVGELMDSIEKKLA